MTDLVDRLWEIDEVSALTNEAARYIEKLEQRIKELEEQVNEMEYMLKEEYP